MAVRRGQIGPLLVTLETAVCHACSAAKLFSPVFNLFHPVQASAGVSRRCMAASARVRSEEEKKSRKAAREEITAAHEKFPFLPTKSTKQVYVLDKDLADEIARVVVKNQSDPSTPILESNPGPGILTKALLKAGAKQIVLAESTKGFMPYVQALQKKHSRQILASYNMDYLSAWHRLGDPESASTSFEVGMSALFPHRHWAEGPPVSVVTMVPEQKERPFLTHLILALGRQQSFYSLGRPEWFLALSPALYVKLLAVKMEKRPPAFYNHLAIVLHLLFDIRLCAQLPGWKFTPRFPEKRGQDSRKNKPEVSNSMRYLLRLRPHLDQPLKPAQVPEFYSFLGQLMQRKKFRIIPKMEQLVPGCGPHLIRLQVTMMSLVADMSPLQLLTIFKAMQTWPQYQGSPLQQLLASGALPAAEDDGAEDTHKDSSDRSAKKQTTDSVAAVRKDS